MTAGANCVWVVASEIAKGHGKESSSGRNGKRLKLAVMTAILGGCFMTAGISPVAADLTTDQKAVYEAVMTQLKASGKVELGGTTEDTTGIAIGKDSSTSHHMGVAIGGGAKTDNQGNVAIGHKSYSYDSGVAIGTEARADGLNTVAIGDRVTAKNPYSVAISTGKPNTDHRHKYTEAVNSDHATVLGDDSVVGKDNKYGIAIGSAALSDKSESGMAIGRIATVANSEHGIALGRQSEVKNSNGGIVVGPLSKVLNSNKGLAMGDTAHIEDSEGGVAYGPSAYVTDSSNNGVAIGGSTKVKKSFQGVAIGYSASVENAGGAVAVGEYSQANAKTSVAIGSNSRADVAAGQIGYLGDSKTDDVAWKSSLGAVSVGTASSRWGAMTRQITNLAAGTKATDAVNVAQLTVVNDKADKNITDITDLTKKVKGNTTDITNINSTITNLNQKTETNKTTIQRLGTAPMYFRSGGSKDASGNYTEGNKYWYTTVSNFHMDFGDGLQAEEVQKGDKKRTLVTVNTDKLIDNINSNTTKKITNVDGDNIDLSKNTSITTINNKINNLTTNTGAGAHYFSVTSDKKAAGSNFDNDGAKGTDSMVIGIGSSSEAPNSTVLGNNNTLKRYHKDQNGSSSRNNIVVGQNMEVEGAHNAVFGTDYQNNLENRKTMVAGKRNTVIGVGNLAGYTAEKDPQNRFKWIYSKVENGSDSGNVVVGMNNTATRGSLVIGSESEATSSGISVGHHNKVVSDEDFGVALGSDLVVDGYGSIAVGRESKATADYATAIGQGAIAGKESSIAIGDAAKAKTRGGIAIGSSSLADREKGAIGYTVDTEQAKKLKEQAVLASEYDTLYQAYQNTPSGSTEETEARTKLQEFKTQHADFMAARDELATWRATDGAVSVGDSAKHKTRQITNLAAGTQDTDAVNVAQLKALNTKVDQGAIHYFSVKSDDSAKPAGTNWNNDGATGQDAIAIGKNAVSEGQDAIAIGKNAVSDRQESTAIGSQAQAYQYYSTAIGSTAIAGSHYSTALGYGAQADLNRSTAIGSTAIAGGHYSTALGYGAQADWTYSTALGGNADAQGLHSTALGGIAKAQGHYSTVLGYKAEALADGSVALGNDAVAGREAGTVGYFASASGTTLDDVLTALDKKTDYDNWTATINASKAEYERLTNAYFNASESDKAAAKAALDTWKEQHKAFVKALEERTRLEATWKASRGAVSVGADGFDEAGNTIIESRQITNVAAGTEDTDAVNVAQLKVVNEKADKNATDITNLTKTVNANGKATIVKVDGKEESTDGNLKITKKTENGQTTYDLSLSDEITIGKDGKDGKIGINGKDGASAEITVGKGEPGVDGKDGETITRIIYTDKDGKEHKVATLDDGLKFKGDNDTVVTRKLNTQLNITGGITDKAELSNNNIGVVGTQDGGMAIKLSKKLKGLTSAEFVDGDKVTNITAQTITQKDGDNITNITGGNVTITRKEGNVDLWELNKTVNNITQGTTDVSSWKLQANGENERTIKKGSVVNFKNGQNTEVTVNGDDITVDLNADTKKQIKDNTTNITNIDKRVTSIENNIDQKIEGAKITVQGDKDTGVKATEVKNGDKVTGYKVSLEKKVKVGNVTIDGTDKKGEITGLTNTTVEAADFATKGRAATEEQLKAAMDKAVAQGTTTVKAGDKNISVVKTENKNEYTVGLAKDITVNSVTAKTVKADEYKVGDKTYINKDGINANGNKITNVGDGVVSKESTDAVNGKQLFATNQMIANNMNQINNLREESREGDAMGSAMAALKPLDFDPYQRNQVMAGVGYYRGKEAVALGLAHYKNEDLMIHGGLAYAGNSELMANVGVSYRFGSSENREAKKARNLRMPQYDKGPISSVYILQDEVERLTKENKEANDRIAALEAKLEKVLEKVK